VPFSSDIIDRTDVRVGNRDSGGERNTTLAPILIMMQPNESIADAIDRAERRFKETLGEDVALDRFGLSSQLVPLLAERIDDRRRR